VRMRTCMWHHLENSSELHNSFCQHSRHFSDTATARVSIIFDPASARYCQNLPRPDITFDTCQARSEKFLASFVKNLFRGCFVTHLSVFRERRFRRLSASGFKRFDLHDLASSRRRRNQHDRPSIFTIRGYCETTKRNPRGGIVTSTIAASIAAATLSSLWNATKRLHREPSTRVLGLDSTRDEKVQACRRGNSVSVEAQKRGPSNADR
jgi:hypothetical protein